MQNLMTAKQFNAQFTGSVEIPARPQIFPLTGKLRCHVTVHSESCTAKYTDPVGVFCGCGQCENDALPHNYEYAWPICAEHQKRFEDSRKTA